MVYNKAARDAGQVITIGFSLVEAAADGYPIVRLGTANVSSCTQVGLDYSCTYTLSGSDEDGAQRVTIRTADDAGNEVEESNTVVTFDFTPPTVLASPSQSAYPLGGVLRYTVTANEQIEITTLTASPALDLVTTNEPPSVSYLYNYGPFGSGQDGDYTVTYRSRCGR